VGPRGEPDWRWRHVKTAHRKLIEIDDKHDDRNLIYFDKNDDV
jgi:hypothetical protein